MIVDNTYECECIYICMFVRVGMMGKDGEQAEQAQGCNYHGHRDRDIKYIRE